MLELQPQTFKEFRKHAKNGNMVPVVRSVLADLQTPVGAYMRVAHGSKNAFLFESIEGGERLARYSFIGAHPEMVVRGRGDKTFVEKDGETQEIDSNIVDFLRSHFSTRKLAERPNLPPLCGGAVGFFAYDAIRWFEPEVFARENSNAAPKQDEAVWLFFRNILIFDRVKQRIEIVSLVDTTAADGDEQRLRELYEAAIDETAQLEELLLIETPPFRHDNLAPYDHSAKIFLSNWKKNAFLKAVEKVKQHILAGNAYQVVLSQKFRRQATANPLDVYRALRMTNPSPYMFFLRLATETLIGASPEMLVRVRDGNKVSYRPIAGTRKRGENEQDDWLLGEELRADEKETAEHLMLVDLGRNDLGKIAEFGSVQVEELMSIERYSHVQHLVTSLQADLRQDCDRFDALASCFPAGTVSGAPKIRAMQIIEELEPTKRGIYAGAVGYIDYAQNLDTCIAIRTVQLKDGWASIQAGAGIVADSVPEKEYEETINKARALVKAIEIAENGL